MPQICPSCHYSKSWVLRREKRKCKKCRHEFSPKKYLVKGVRSAREEWQQCISVFLRERASNVLVRECNIGANRAFRMTHILRVCMLLDTPRVFEGPVELDETYIGGQRKNKRLHIRRIQAKRGHGTDKLPIVGIFDRTTKQVYVDVMPRKLSMDYIRKTLSRRVIPGCHIFTDGYKMYRGLNDHGYYQTYVDHDGGEYVRGIVHTNNIEGFWGILKRKLSCIGGMRRVRLQYFVGEITWRFNHRHESLETQAQRLLELVTLFGG